MMHELVKALQKIGKTRFGTNWTACLALEPCLSFIRSLVSAKIIKFKVVCFCSSIYGTNLTQIIQNTKVQSLPLSHLKYTEFEHQLQVYKEIVTPLIWSLWSLEVAHANASYVFLFWLASAATLKDLFDRRDTIGLSDEMVEAVMGIYNKWYEEFFRNDLYFVAFILGPRKCVL